MEKGKKRPRQDKDISRYIHSKADTNTYKHIDKLTKYMPWYRKTHTLTNIQGNTHIYKHTEKISNIDKSLLTSMVIER